MKLKPLISFAPTKTAQLGVQAVEKPQDVFVVARTVQQKLFLEAKMQINMLQALSQHKEKRDFWRISTIGVFLQPRYVSREHG